MHESHGVCGIGAEIAFIINDLAFDWLDAPIKWVTSVQAPIPYSRKLEQMTVPSSEKIVETVKEILNIN